MQTMTSATYTASLTQEWDEVHAPTPLPHEWRLIAADMHDLETVDELLVEMGPRGRFANDDAVYLAMITRAQAGEDLAGRLLLQRLWPRCVQLLGTCSGRGLDDQAADVHAAAWEAIMTYPLSRSQKVRINLSMQVLHHLPQESNHGAIARGHDLHDLMADSDAPSWNVGASEGGFSAAAEVSELLLWAMDHEVVTRQECAMVYRATLDAETSTSAALEEIAHEVGVTGRCMRGRYARVVDRIAAAVAVTA